MESSGRSLSVIVPFPAAMSSVAPDGLLRVRVKRSSDSWKVSSTVGTEMVWTVCPTVNLSVPDLDS